MKMMYMLMNTYKVVSIDTYNAVVIMMHQEKISGWNALNIDERQ